MENYIATIAVWQFLLERLTMAQAYRNFNLYVLLTNKAPVASSIARLIESLGHSQVSLHKYFLPKPGSRGQDTALCKEALTKSKKKLGVTIYYFLLRQYY